MIRYVKIWIAAARPHTLSASVVPVIVGTAMGYALGALDWGLFTATLLATVLVQIGTNLTDEYADHDATDSAHKYAAPHKVIARGLLGPAAVKAGAALCFGVAALLGIWLVWLTGWPLLVLCLASVAVAYGYAAGPMPLGDHALGELIVFWFMGPVIVGGTLYVQTHGYGWDAFWLSVPVGALVTAILVVNNLRDREEDARHGRRTLVTVLGDRPLRIAYLLLLLAAFTMPFVAILAGWGGPLLVLPALTIPLAARVIGWVLGADDRETLHRALKGTSALHMAFGLLLAAGLAIGGMG